MNYQLSKDDILLWTRLLVSDLFKTHRIWPTFIGNSLDPMKNLKTGVLPVALWNEQVHFINKHDKLNVEISSNNRSNRKRKLDALENEDSEPVDKKANKRFKVVETMLYWFNRLYYYIFTNKLINQTISSNNSQNISAVNNNKSNDSVLIRNKVYEDFQLREQFIGPGDIYGGDYTLYKGDSPADSHAHATVQIVSSHLIPSKNAISFCRVQTQVSKAAVFAFPKSNDINNSKPIVFPKIFDELNDKIIPIRNYDIKSMNVDNNNKTEDVKYLSFFFKEVTSRY